MLNKDKNVKEKTPKSWTSGSGSVLSCKSLACSRFPFICAFQLGIFSESYILSPLLLMKKFILYTIYLSWCKCNTSCKLSSKQIVCSTTYTFHYSTIKINTSISAINDTKQAIITIEHTSILIHLIKFNISWEKIPFSITDRSQCGSMAKITFTQSTCNLVVHVYTD